MTNYPNDIDTDLQIPRIENDITEMGGDSINALRDAVFAIQTALGINPQSGSTSLADRLAVSLQSDGSIKPLSLSGIGLISLPILESMFNNSSIGEIKLNLNVPTNTLNANIQSIKSDNTLLQTYFGDLNGEFISHIYGLTNGNIDGYSRHVASHIDINKKTNDPRDTGYHNTGLTKIDGTDRAAATVMDALLQINNDLISHMNSLSTSNKHLAEFIELNTTGYGTIPLTANTVQKAFDFIDTEQTVLLEEHRSCMHSTGITRNAIVEGLNLDGYNTFFGPFTCETKNSSSTNESTLTTFVNPGDLSLDWAFSQLVAGDIAKINYGGFEVEFPIERINYLQNTTYSIVLDGYNIIETQTATVILEKSKYDENHYGKLAVCPVVHNYYRQPTTPNDPENSDYTQYANAKTVPSSAIIVSPNCPMVCGFDLSLQDLDETRYMLYLALYPNGNPKDKTLVPPLYVKGIDVTGNVGTTPGSYNLSTIIDATNKEFRRAGYNHRFVAFEYKGQFGIALSDNIDNVGFSIVSSTDGVSIGSFVNNVIDIINQKDPLGLGSLKSNMASPLYNESNIIPTKVFVGKKNKKYNINGQFIDYLANGYLTNSNGYYDGYLTRIEPLFESDPFNTRYRGYYKIDKNLKNSKLIPGASIVVMPKNVSTEYNINYGRFIIESIDYTCDGYNIVKVIDCLGMQGKPISPLTTINPNANNPSTYLQVRIYFGDDSVNYPVYPGNNKSYFETYITKNGTTFAHRRASMPIQDGSIINSLLLTNVNCGIKPSNNKYKLVNFGWHIVNVSQKLRGFQLATETTQSSNKYVRLVISNATNGMFDGYICQPDTLPSTPNRGATVSGVVGQPIRLYDNTGIDYIDVLFDNDTKPDEGIVFPTNGYVDIKIFDTLKTNEEFLCLSSCEQLNCADGAILTNFKDLRQFGTVSEKILSSSAIKFIESGDRLLHQNGVISGFEYVSTNNTTITINGGTALINGIIVNKNNFSIPIYNAYQDSVETVKFIVCIKDDNSYEVLTLSNTGDGVGSISSYNTSATSSAYKKIYTFNEIIKYRKDLLPIYEVDITTTNNHVYVIKSVPKDIRKFISNNEIKSNIVLYNSDKNYSSTPIGNFTTWESVSNYVSLLNGIQNTIIVKGTTSIDKNILFSKPVSIIGDPENIVKLMNNSAKLSIVSDSIIEKINFIRYFGDKNETAQPFVSDEGTIALLSDSYIDGFGSIKNITIDNCTFDTNINFRVSGVAHILFQHTGDSSIIENITISNNKFLEVKTQLCMAFVNKGGTALANEPYKPGTILHNVLITNNTGNFGSWILLSSDNGDVGSAGLLGYGVKITNNSFDFILCNMGELSSVELSSGVLISHNTFIGLAHRDLNCSVLKPANIKVGNATYIIDNNICSEIYMIHCFDSNYNSGKINANNNIFRCNTYGLAVFSPSDNPITVLKNALIIHAEQNDSNGIIANINNNTFGTDVNGNNKYYYGITSKVSSNISGNIMDNCFTNYGAQKPLPIGVWANNNEIFNVTNNTIKRGNDNIYAYVNIIGANCQNVVVTDNYFDSDTVNGTLTTLVNVVTSNCQYKPLIMRNKNQQFEIDLTPYIYYSSVNRTYGISYCGWDVVANSLGILGIESTTQYMAQTPATYYLLPFYINMPIIDGANPMFVKFEALISKTTPGTYKPSVAMIPATILPITSGSVIADATPITVIVDVSSLPSEHKNTYSYNKQYNLSVEFDYSNDSDLTLVYSTSATADSAKVYNIKGVYKY